MIDKFQEEQERELREAAKKMSEACAAFYCSDESCCACPAYIENKLTGETRCYFSDTWTEPHDWDV